MEANGKSGQIGRRRFLGSTAALGAAAAGLTACAGGAVKTTPATQERAPRKIAGMNALLINTHLPYPGWSEGKLNASAQAAAREFFEDRGDSVVETHVASGYDAAAEEKKFLAADAIIVQMPVNWFSAPWIWKKYVDEVFNVGLHNGSFLTGDGRTRSDPTKPYGSGGLMAPRRVLVCSTWNAPREAFDAPANPVFRGMSLDTALAEITAPFRFCGFEVLPGFAFLDIFKNPKIKEDLEAYRAHLAAQFA